ncbi:hypothetical protein BDP27DRAFT_1034944 [Rhodocollybia butyracea]|uniref:Uncharacterized protein n=1 Tax=Rhodocollybia butyracea TaxID=206335 RepID=A0A9P5UDS1_9AGAR|nr:hypothetical protein BDP27DRAFT_1034944 [Rhodocollybia butyracea]
MNPYPSNHPNHQGQQRSSPASPRMFEVTIRVLLLHVGRLLSHYAFVYGLLFSFYFPDLPVERFQTPSDNPSTTSRSHIEGTFRSGAFSAVAGDQTIQQVSSSAGLQINRDSYAHQNPNPNPSVLRDFRRHSKNTPAHPPGTIFGEASFSAVSGYSTICTPNHVSQSLGTHSTDVLLIERNYQTVTIQAGALPSSLLGAIALFLDTKAKAEISKRVPLALSLGTRG